MHWVDTMRKGVLVQIKDWTPLQLRLPQGIESREGERMCPAKMYPLNGETGWMGTEDEEWICVLGENRK